MKVSFKVSPHLTSWSSEEFDEPFNSPIVHEVNVTKKAQVQQIAAAEAAGSLLDVKYDDDAQKHADGAVESDEDSLKYQEKVMADGSWQEANAAQFELQLAQAVEVEEDDN